MLTLEKPNHKNLNKIKAGLQEINNNPTPFDIRSVKKMIESMQHDFDGYLAELEKGESPNQPENRVPNTVLLLFDDDQFIGVFDIRHKLNEALMNGGGHIGYQIIPSERKKGYLKAGLKLVLTWCYQELGLDEVLLFCNAENAGSDRGMTSVMNEMGGKRLPDQIIDDHLERGVWINTH